MTQPITDGFVTTAGGCHTGLRPALLTEEQYARGINITSRGGQVSTRPRFVKVSKLSDPGFYNGASMYRLNSVDRLAFAVDGKVRLLNLSTMEISEIGELSPDVRYYFVKADRYFVVQDNVNRPLFLYEDSLLRQAIPYRELDGDDERNTYNEVFTGGPMAYGHGRIFTVAKHIHDLAGIPDETTEGRPYFVAGNLIDSANSEEVLWSASTSYLNSGASAVQPLEMGFINALAFYRNTQTGTGQGPLLSFAKDGVAAYSVNLPDGGWQSVDFSQVLFFGSGCESPWSITNVNDDLFYRSQDGIRSIRHTTQQEAGSGNLSATPISSEVSYFLNFDTASDLRFATGSFAGSRFLMTSCGRKKGAFRGVVSLDTATAYSMSMPSNPMYDGAWTGLPFLHVDSARYDLLNTHYFVTQGPNGIDLWRLDDEAYSDNGARPLCRLYTREYSFGEVIPKRYAYTELFFSNIKGDLDVTVYFKADGYELWSPCNTQVISTDVGEGTVPQSRYRVRVSPLEEFASDQASGRDVRLGVGFQFCIEWKGHATIEKVLFFADPVTDEPPEIQCDNHSETVALTEGSSGILLDDFIYDIYTETGENL